MANTPNGPKRIHDMKGPNNPIPGSENWPAAQVNHMTRLTMHEPVSAVRPGANPSAEPPVQADDTEPVGG